MLHELEITATGMALLIGQYLALRSDESHMPSVYIAEEKTRVSGDLARLGWKPETDLDLWWPSWVGRYVKDGRLLHVAKAPSELTMVTGWLEDRSVVVLCSDWSRPPELHDHDRLAMAVGYALGFAANETDIVFAAVPETHWTALLADVFRSVPAFRRSGIRIALVRDNGTIEGMSL